METEKEVQQLKEDLETIEVKELSPWIRIFLFLFIIGFILFSIWWEFFK